MKYGQVGWLSIYALLVLYCFKIFYYLFLKITVIPTKPME